MNDEVLKGVPMSVLCDGAVTEPRLSHPEGIAVAADGFVWCGGERGEIYRIAPDGSSREIVASTDGFCLGMAFDRDGDLFVCDQKHAAVFRLQTSTGKLELFADGVSGHRFRIPNYPAFFGRVRSMLNDGGLYLNHGIHHEFHWRRTTQTDFLYRNVFPNGDLSGLTETLTEMERARWEVLDVENLRLHYARTCRHWAERLQARAEEARAIVGERIYRTWLLYLTCSSVAFAGGSIGLYQVLMRKQWDKSFTRPTTREDLYA